MNVIDILVLIIVGFCIIFSLKKGFIKSVFEIIAFIVAGLVAYNWFMDLGEVIGPHIKINAKFVYIISYSLIWIGAFLVVNFIGTIAQKVINKTFLLPVNIALSIIFGLIKGVFFSSLIIVPIILTSSVYKPLTKHTDNSHVIKHSKPLINSLGKKIIPKDMPNIFDMNNKFLKTNENKNDVLQTLSPQKLNILEKISKQINNSNDQSLENVMSSIKPEDLSKLLDIAMEINPENGPISAKELQLKLKENKSSN